jgi:hypothetical protein
MGSNVTLNQEEARFSSQKERTSHKALFEGKKVKPYRSG